MRNITDDNIKEVLVQLSLILSWNVSIENSQQIPHCFDVFLHDKCKQVYAKHQTNSDQMNLIKLDATTKQGHFLGRAFVYSYYVSGIIVPKNCLDSISFSVQSVDITGRREPISDDSILNVHW